MNAPRLAALCRSAGLVFALLAAHAFAAPPRPNIVVLVADDWGFTDVGAFGGEIATPNLDSLAARGVRFSNFHVSASCSPTRSMLLTGVDNHLNGVGNLRETMPREHKGRPGYLGSLNRNVVTVATLLKEGGYRTYAAGKWNVGSEPHNLPDARGFDRSIVQGDTGSDNWVPSQRYLDLADKVHWFEDGREAAMPAEFYSSQYFVDRAIEFIRSGKGTDKPFFAYVAFQANHIPMQAPREFIDKYRGVYKGGWEALRRSRREGAVKQGVVPAESAIGPMPTTRDWNALGESDRAYEARRMEVYAGMAEAMDHHVGRLIEFLRSTGEFDNTVFVFLSDNGSEGADPYANPLGRLWLDLNYSRDIDRLGGKGAYSVIGPSWASAAVSPLSTFKFYSGEGGIRVPLIISGAPGTRQGGIHHAFAHVTDIAPTLLALAGQAPPGEARGGQRIEPMRGASLLPVLRGEADRAHAPDEVIGHELSGNRALFKGDLKLVSVIPPLGDGVWHLYDVRRDPGETRDLKDAMPKEFAQMQADYEAWAQRHGVLPMPADFDPYRQVAVNALLDVYVPRYRFPALVAAVLLAVLAWRVMRRRARRRSMT